jgi:hypothetical protein
VPGDIGNNWDNAELEWCVLAACFQVSVAGPEPQSDWGKTWIQAMPHVHALMGYRAEAPQDEDVDIANDFCERLAAGGDDNQVHIAWMLANRPDSTTCPGRFATAIVNVNNLDDRMYTLDAFPTADNPGNTYRYYWIEREGEWPFFSYWIVYMAITVP